MCKCIHVHDSTHFFSVYYYTRVYGLQAIPHLISDVEGVSSGVDDELMVGWQDAGVVDDVQDTCEHQKQPIAS